VQVGAISVDPMTAEVNAVLPPPPGLLSAREVRAIAQALRAGKEPPTLAAVDLAERQAVAGGYAQPTRTQLTTRPVATYSLIAAFVVVFIIEKALLRDPNGLFFMGALDSLQPDWWRFVTYAFLHDPGGGSFGVSGLPTHVIFNSIAMYIVGRLVEQLYGWRVLLSTFLVTAVAGGLASVAIADITNTDTLTVGASGGIMGLLGLLFMLGRHQGREVPVGVAHAMRQYALTYGAMVVIFGFLITNTNNVAHIGGFIAGALVGLALPPLSRVGGRDLQQWEQLAVYAVFAVSAIAIVFGAADVIGMLGANPFFRTTPG
jgi:rhomboid protease GluP